MTVTHQFRAGSGFWTVIEYLVVPGVLDGRLLCALAQELTLLGGLTHEFSA